MKFNKQGAYIHVPDGTDPEVALSRTTHLAVGAHQDDIEIMAYHGIAECFGQDDKHFSGVTVTDGAGSPRAGKYSDMTDEDMQKVRQEEQRKAADIGEYACMIQLLYPSSDIKDAGNKSAVADIGSIMEVANPDIVYLHNPADKHDTHVATLLRAIEAIRGMPLDSRPGKVYGCEVWRDLDWLVDDDKQPLGVDKFSDLAA